MHKVREGPTGFRLRERGVQAKALGCVSERRWWGQLSVKAKSEGSLPWNACFMLLPVARAPCTDRQCQKQVQTARLRVNPPQPPLGVKHQMPGLSRVGDKVLLGAGMTVKLLQHLATSLHQGNTGLRL